MSIQFKLKILDKSGKTPQINIPKILEGLLHEEAGYSIENNAIFLTAVVPTKQLFVELKRRLSAKKNRPETVVEVLDYRELNGDKK
jgi:hypothetical protein